MPLPSRPRLPLSPILESTRTSVRSRLGELAEDVLRTVPGRAAFAVVDACAVGSWGVVADIEFVRGLLFVEEEGVV